MLIGGEMIHHGDTKHIDRRHTANVIGSKKNIDNTVILLNYLHALFDSV